MKRERKFGIAVFVLILCGLGSYEAYFKDDFTLSRVAKSFQELRHPAGSRLIARSKNLGLLLGNGNHCDYFVGELRTSTLSQSEIEDFYEGETVLNPLTKRHEHIFLAFRSSPGKFEAERFDNLPYSDDAAFENAMAQAPAGAYIVFFFAGGYGPGLDMRCS